MAHNPIAPGNVSVLSSAMSSAIFSYPLQFGRSKPARRPVPALAATVSRRRWKMIAADMGKSWPVDPDFALWGIIKLALAPRLVVSFQRI